MGWELDADDNRTWFGEKSCALAAIKALAAAQCPLVAATWSGVSCRWPPIARQRSAATLDGASVHSSDLRLDIIARQRCAATSGRWSSVHLSGIIITKPLVLKKFKSTRNSGILGCNADGGYESLRIRFSEIASTAYDDLPSWRDI